MSCGDLPPGPSRRRRSPGPHWQNHGSDGHPTRNLFRRVRVAPSRLQVHANFMLDSAYPTWQLEGFNQGNIAQPTGRIVLRTHRDMQPPSRFAANVNRDRPIGTPVPCIPRSRAPANRGDSRSPLFPDSGRIPVRKQGTQTFNLTRKLQISSLPVSRPDPESRE